jgi:hypothetical protein
VGAEPVGRPASGPLGLFDRLHPALLLLLVLAAGAWRASKAMHVNTAYDGFGYIMIARSILDGHLATPYLAKGILLHFDPLYPWLVALLEPLSGDLFTSSRVVNVIAGTLLALPVYGFARDVFGRRAALFSVALLVAHPVLVRVSATAFSEAVYLLFALTGLWWWWRAWSRGGWGWALGGAMMMALASLTRTQGVSWLLSALLGLSALRLLSARSAPARFVPKLGVAVALFLVSITPYRLYQESLAAQAGGSSKLWQEFHKKTSAFGRLQWVREERTLSDAGDRLAWVALAEEAGPGWIARQPRRFASRVARDLGYFVELLGGPQFLPRVVLLPTALAVLLAVFRRTAFRQALGYLALTLTGTILALGLVAVTIDRYLAVAAPVLVIVAAGGGDALCRWLASNGGRGRAVRLLAGVSPFAIVLASLGGYPSIVFYEQEQARGKPVDQLNRAIAAWAAERLDPSKREVVMASDPGVPAVTGDYFYLLPLGAPERVARYARVQGADYLLVDSDYLKLQSADARALWLRLAGERGFSSVGLERIGEDSFAVEGNYVFREVWLLKVLALTNGSSEDGS